MNEQKIQLCIDALAADVADKLAQESGADISNALREFMKTKRKSRETKLCPVSGAGYAEKLTNSTR